MGPRILTYKGDVTHMIGESFVCPRFMVGGGVHLVRWVATDATYVKEWDKTFVEMDVSAPQPPVELA